MIWQYSCKRLGKYTVVAQAQCGSRVTAQTYVVSDSAPEEAKQFVADQIWQDCAEGRMALRVVELTHEIESES